MFKIKAVQLPWTRVFFAIIMLMMWIPAEQVDPCKDGKSHLGSSVYLNYLWRVWRSFLNFMQDHAGNMLEGPGRVMLCPWNYFVRSTVPASLASSGGGDTSTKAYWDSGAVTILPRPGAILVFVPGLRESWLLWLAGASASSCPVHRSFATWEYQDLFREEGRSGAKTHCAIARQFPRYSKYAIKKKNNGATIFPRTTRGKTYVEDRERGSQNLNMGTSKEKVMRVTMNHGFNIDFLDGTEIQEHEHLMLPLRITIYIYIYISYIGYYIYPKSE